MENGKNLIHSFNASDGLFGNFKGLTKREYFAGLAMQGLLANPNTGCECAEKIAELAVNRSDELLKQLEK
jgi:hypothetical protein